MKELAPRRWEAVQRIVDEAGEVDWAIVCEVDLTGAARSGPAAPRARPHRDLSPARAGQPLRALRALTRYGRNVASGSAFGNSTFSRTVSPVDRPFAQFCSRNGDE